MYFFYGVYNDSHFSSFQGDHHLVIGDKVRLGTVQCDLHFLLNTWGTKTRYLVMKIPKGVYSNEFRCVLVMVTLTQREGRGPGRLRVERNSVRWDALVQIQQGIHSKHHNTTWREI